MIANNLTLFPNYYGSLLKIIPMVPLSQNHDVSGGDTVYRVNFSEFVVACDHAARELGLSDIPCRFWDLVLFFKKVLGEGGEVYIYRVNSEYLVPGYWDSQAVKEYVGYINRRPDLFPKFVKSKHAVDAVFQETMPTVEAAMLLDVSEEEIYQMIRDLELGNLQFLNKRGVIEFRVSTVHAKKLYNQRLGEQL